MFVNGAARHRPEIGSALCLAHDCVNALLSDDILNLVVAENQQLYDAHSVNGVVAGAEFMYQASDILGVSFGALYSMQGCKGKEEGVDATFKTDYINIPILANVYVAKGLAVKLGLQPGFCVNNKIKFEKDGTKLETDGFDENTVDLSMPIGLSYEFDNIVIEGRYNFGLTKVWKDMDNKNSVFQFTVGYKLPL